MLRSSIQKQKGLSAFIKHWPVRPCQVWTTNWPAATLWSQKQLHISSLYQHLTMCIVSSVGITELRLFTTIYYHLVYDWSVAVNECMWSGMNEKDLKTDQNDTLGFEWEIRRRRPAWRLCSRYHFPATIFRGALDACYSFSLYQLTAIGVNCVVLFADDFG